MSLAQAPPETGVLDVSVVLPCYNERDHVVVNDPERVVWQAVAAGTTETSPVGDERGWRLGRIVDPFGHEWEIGAPLRNRPPSQTTADRWS